MFLIVYVTQNFIEFDSDYRKDFYFVGMSIVTLIFSVVLYGNCKNFLTGGFIFFCLGHLINELVYRGETGMISIYFLTFGFVVYFIEKAIRKSFER